MSAPPEIADLQHRLDQAPGDHATRESLARALVAAGRGTEAAAEFLRSAYDARAAGDEQLYRDRVAAGVAADPDLALLFTDRPAARAVAEPSQASALVAHPEGRVAHELAAFLAAHGYPCEVATTGSAALAAVAAAPEILVLSPLFADREALEVARAARARRPNCAVILLTCAARRQLAPDEAALGSLVDERLDRPLASTRLLEAVRAALWRQRNAAPIPGARGPAPPVTVGSPPLGSNLVRALLVVAVGYLLMFAVHQLMTASPPAADDLMARGLTWQSAVASDISGNKLEVIYRTPSEMRDRTYADEMRPLAADDVAAFELRVSRPGGGLEPGRLAETLEAVVLEQMVLEPRALVIEPATTDPVVLYVAFERASLAGAAWLQLTVRPAEEELTLRLLKRGGE